MHFRWFTTLCCAHASLLAIASLVSQASAAVDLPAELAEKFTRDVTPFVSKHCADCHDKEEPQAGLTLTTFAEAKAIVPDREHWEKVLELVSSGSMPPSDQPQPPAADVEKFTSVVQAIFDHVDKTSPRDPGRVTVRRLNRVEYNNTIRDLFGVDLRPADDFPSDDVGHGFDNIGDVLTVSPVLMERYLAAAESVSSRIITPEAPQRPNRFLSCKYVEPAGSTVPQSQYRPMTSEPKESGIETGPFFTSYMMDADGEYRFRIRCYTSAPKEQKVTVAILACGKDIVSPAGDGDIADLAGAALSGLRPFRVIARQEVTAREQKEAQNLEFTIPPMAGIERMAVALVKPGDGQPHVTLHIEWFNLEGPMDTRPRTHRELLATTAADDEAKSREVFTRFLARAFRRKPTADEIEKHVKYVASVQSSEQLKWEAAMQRGVQVVLCSPKFLFRTEPDYDPENPNVHAIDQYQLASRLSYFLWSSMPDDELFALASQNRLVDDLDNQVRRMLKDPKSQALVDNFALQWLQLQRITQITPDPEKFPNFDDRLKASMVEETKLFLREIIQNDRSILELIDADYTFLNERLARHYGIIDTMGNTWETKPRREGGQQLRGREFQKVMLGPDSHRGGLLTQASVLTVTSNPTRTSPVKRGRWVLEQILGTPPPPPPPNVPELDKEGAALTGTLRQRLEQHRENIACASCHARMDPLGFAFENFDAVGAFRKTDGSDYVDASGVLPDGRKFNGPAELKEILKTKAPQVRKALTEKLLTYATGRGLEYYDKPAVRQIVESMPAGEDRFSHLVLGIVRSDPFMLRRGKETQP
ncbi:Protein of unknown function DUF1592 [Pirellula staleyi DSM 6068]|uniref:Cytochrome c domain-containing protein n=1 Tax=Pirellula staleyi (strain ATCC 27377 / DSM 6068 / ICPB 4128) TaxID=530564 RepID=D2QXH9_PIRSD|nr:DUF1592 domain-containing protein [Pirellula staleyi]ADB16164.1 Protein of unknown function DUF1592 [Pirellula staleyi DSM 6068]